MISGDDMVTELNRRLAVDPGYEVPDGYKKVVDKEYERVYKVPKEIARQVGESVVVGVETVEEVVFRAIGVHVLEPMVVVKEVSRARPVLKAMARDKIMSELNAGKSLMLPPSSQPPLNSRSRAHYVSSSHLRPTRSTDPIPSSTNLIPQSSSNRSVL